MKLYSEPFLTGPLWLFCSSFVPYGIIFVGYLHVFLFRELLKDLERTDICIYIYIYIINLDFKLPLSNHCSNNNNNTTTTTTTATTYCQSSIIPFNRQYAQHSYTDDDIDCLVPQRAIYHFAGNARYLWTHAVRPSIAGPDGTFERWGTWDKVLRRGKTLGQTKTVKQYGYSRVERWKVVINYRSILIYLIV